MHFWSNKTDEEKSQDLSPDDPVFTKKLQTMFNLNEYEWEKNREAVIPFSNKMNSIKEMMQKITYFKAKQRRSLKVDLPMLCLPALPTALRPQWRRALART